MTPSLKNRVLGWLDTIYYIVKNGFDLDKTEAELKRLQDEEIRKAKALLE